MKKIKLYKTILLTCLFWISTLALKAQIFDEDTVHREKKDTVSFRYKFIPKDTLIYFTEAHDSIEINFGKPLVKHRKGLQRIICDSINSLGRYFLSLELIEYSSFEREGKDTITANETPWLNRVVYLEIDSVGNRYSYSIDDSLNSAMNPGGAFNPYMFFPFRDTIKVVNESWSVTSIDELPENGYPVSIIRQSKLLRAMDDIDTLSEKCSRFQFIETGQASIKLINETDSVKTTAIINSFGKLYFSKERKIPVFFYQNMEQKITIKTPKSEPIPGIHFVATTSTLVDYLKYNPQKKIKKKKK